jgi:hypothetical protein
MTTSNNSADNCGSSRCSLVRGGMRFVFLDIDGVLLPYLQVDQHGRACQSLLPKTDGCPAFNPNCVAELNMICDTGRASIVVSSSWRWYFQDIELMRAMLREQGVSALITGMTPFATDGWPSSERGDEIAAFMEPLEVEAFVIIDDADMGFTGLKHHWVRTKGCEGITRRDAVKALKILGAV